MKILDSRLLQILLGASRVNELAHEIKVHYGFPVCDPSNAQVPSNIFATDMHFLPQGLYYMSINSKGSGDTALMRRLTRVLAGHLCDKYPFPTYWLISFFPNTMENLLGMIILDGFQAGFELSSSIKWVKILVNITVTFPLLTYSLVISALNSQT